jgi:hypothetical protein
LAQLKTVAEPFGEVNVYPRPGGRTRVVATILMEPRREGTQTGIALDGSGSMSGLYGGQPSGGVLGGLFGRKARAENQVTPVAQRVCAYLARRLDADGGTTCVYWATGAGGAKVEVVGDLTAEQAERHEFAGPRDFGTGTQLLPAVKYFADRFADAPWGFYVFITDGELHDLEEVKEYSTRLAREVAGGRRRPLKFVLIGLGTAVNEGQMEELDDLDTGTNVDLWDHKIAAQMRDLTDIFAEVVDRNARVADRGRLLDPDGRVLREYSDTGVPGVLEFEVPAGTKYFTLDVDGHRVHQPLADGAAVPAAPSPPHAPPADGGRSAGGQAPAEEVETALPPGEPVPDIHLELDGSPRDAGATRPRETGG